MHSVYRTRWKAEDDPTRQSIRQNHLSRFAGLRCPSEHLELRLDDIHWDTNRFIVRSPKTKHIDGKEQRIVPIFPELLPYLQDAFELVKPSQTHLITRNRNDAGMGNALTTNWRTQFERIIQKAGVKQWPQLFHALRASCKTDLANRFPEHVVCTWLGNSKAVAREHYLVTTEDHYQLATAQNPSHPGRNLTGLEKTSRTQLQENVPSCLSQSGLVYPSPDAQVTLRGFEPRSPP